MELLSRDEVNEILSFLSFSELLLINSLSKRRRTTIEEVCQQRVNKVFRKRIERTYNEMQSVLHPTSPSMLPEHMVKKKIDTFISLDLYTRIFDHYSSYSTVTEVEDGSEENIVRREVQLLRSLKVNNQNSLPEYTYGHMIDSSIALVGPNGSGKTCMQLSYCTNTFDNSYVPTETPNRIDAHVMFNGWVLAMKVYDSAYDIASDNITINNTEPIDAFLLVVKQDSSVDLIEKWIRKTVMSFPCRPIVLVHSQVDVCTPPKYTGPYTRYIIEPVGSCSSLTQMGLKAAFDSAIKHSVIWKSTGAQLKTRKKSCKLQ